MMQKLGAGQTQLGIHLPVVKSGIHQFLPDRRVQCLEMRQRMPHRLRRKNDRLFHKPFLRRRLQ